MFANVSMAGTGAVVLLLETVLRSLGIEFGEGQVAGALDGLFVFVGFLLLVWGQFRRKDLTLGLFRK